MIFFLVFSSLSIVPFLLLLFETRTKNKTKQKNLFKVPGEWRKKKWWWWEKRWNFFSCLEKKKRNNNKNLTNYPNAKKWSKEKKLQQRRWLFSMAMKVNKMQIFKKKETPPSLDLIYSFIYCWISKLYSNNNCECVCVFVSYEQVNFNIIKLYKKGENTLQSSYGHIIHQLNLIPHHYPYCCLNVIN